MNFTLSAPLPPSPPPTATAPLVKWKLYYEFGHEKARDINFTVFISVGIFLFKKKKEKFVFAEKMRLIHAILSLYFLLFLSFLGHLLM